MKKIISVLLVMVIAFSAVLLMVSCKDEEARGEVIVEYVDNGTENPYLIKKYENGEYCEDNFRILTTTDMHLGGNQDVESSEYAGTKLAVGLLGKYIDLENPDLVVLTGDILLGREWKNCADEIISLFEEKKQYWFMVLGNHDGEGIENGRRDIIAYVEKSEYCLTKTGDTFGYGNFAINIKNGEGKVIQTLFGIDSNDYINPTYCAEDKLEYIEGSYGYIRPVQTEWYKAKLDAIATANGGIMPKSLVYIHIPLPEINDVASSDRIVGKRREPPCNSKVNSGFFTAISEKGSTQAVYFGHDHVNDLIAKYRDVYFVYSASLSYNSYTARTNLFYALAKEFNDGYTITEIKADGSMDVPVHHYNQEIEGIFSGYENYVKKLEIDATMPQ